MAVAAVLADVLDLGAVEVVDRVVAVDAAEIAAGVILALVA